MAFGVIRWIQFLATLAVAGPVALFGVNALLGGRTVGLVFLALAVGLVLLSEYVYIRLTRGTVERAKEATNVRLRDRLRR